MLVDLPVPKDSVIGELGVMRGDFSYFILDRLRPRKFFGFDIFNGHQWDAIWGVPIEEFFAGKTHLEYYKDKLRPFADRVVIEQGWNAETLPKYQEPIFDLLYIDAGHSYEDVLYDAEQAKRMLKPSGLLVFNDYIMFDHHQGAPYGIVPVVNQMVVNEGWRVIAFALQIEMFCDIAIQRIAPAA